MEIRVNCYAGYRGEQTPRTIWFGEQKITVSQILDMWLAPDHRYFKFTGSDQNLYIIRQDTLTSVWELTYFKQG